MSIEGCQVVVLPVAGSRVRLLDVMMKGCQESKEGREARTSAFLCILRAYLTPPREVESPITNTLTRPGDCYERVHLQGVAW